MENVEGQYVPEDVATERGEERQASQNEHEHHYHQDDDRADRSAVQRSLCLDLDY